MEKAEIKHICYPKEHCLGERQKYGSQLYPVCPVLKKLISEKKLYDLPDISNKTPQPLPSIVRISLVCELLIRLRPIPEIIVWCAHRDNFLSEWLEPIRDDLNNLPTRLEKDYPNKSKECRELFDQLKSVESDYSGFCSKFIYLLPPKIKQPNFANFLSWRQSQIIQSRQKGTSDAMTVKRLTCTYPAEAVMLAHKIHNTLSPLVSILPASSDKDKVIEAGDGKLEILKEPSEKVENVFKKTGNYWQVTYQGKSATVKDSKGMNYIYHLLQNPEKSFSAVQLVSQQNNQIDFGKRAKRQEIIDKKGLQFLRLRLIEIEKEIAEADKDCDPEKLAELKDEKQKIESQLKSVKTPAGESRPFSDELTKASKAVSIAIKRALDNIKEHNQSLYRHLDNSILCGSYFTYEPDRETVW